MTWAKLHAVVAEKEAAAPERRVTRIFYAGDDAPAMFHGRFSNAPVEARDAPGFQWNDGEIVNL